MKNLLLLVLMTFGFMFSNAQSVSTEIVVNPLIFDYYPESKIEYLLKEEPEVLVYWNAIYDFGYEVKTISKSESVKAESYPEVEVENLKKVNILKMNLYPKKEETQVFRIKNTNKLLILKSEKAIYESFKKTK